MIYWAPFLHFYQPPIQYHAVLKRICNECYRPLIKTLLEHPTSRVTINMCGVLTEILNDHGAGDVLDGIKELAKKGQLEFVESAKYHAILPLIPEDEARRQLQLNHQTNKFFFKDTYKPRGVFPPEMCFSTETAKVIKDMGYEWILISGIASEGTWPLDFVSSVTVGASAINIFFRDDILSNRISFHNVDSKGFIKDLVGLSAGHKDIYVVTAMDAETFGHHIRNWEKLFLADVYETIDELESTYILEGKKGSIGAAKVHKDIFSELNGSAHIQAVTISQLLDKFPQKKAKTPKPSSWSTTKEDIIKKNYYPLWNDPQNPIHELQWEHVGLCTEIVNASLELKDSNKDSRILSVFSRGLLDSGLHSCQFWWANKNRGTWNINLINKGLIQQEEAILNAYKAICSSSVSDDIKKEIHHKVAAARDVAAKIRDILAES